MARDLSAEELQLMRENYAKRSQEKRESIAAGLAEAGADAERIIDYIWNEYRPVRIRQWGSLLDERHFSERSDIDIALEGITDAERFFAILAAAESMTRFPVDIVQLETIHPEYAESIRQRGRIVREC